MEDCCQMAADSTLLFNANRIILGYEEQVAKGTMLREEADIRIRAVRYFIVCVFKERRTRGN